MLVLDLKIHTVVVVFVVCSSELLLCGYDVIAMKRRLLEALGPETAGGRGWVSIRGNSARLLPPGPSNLDELFAWPLDIARAIGSERPSPAGPGEGEARVHRLHAVLNRGLHCDSLYSGFDCPRWAITPTLDAVVAHYGFQFSNPDHVVITFGSACDWGDLQRLVLYAISTACDDSKSCVMKNIMDRLPQTARNMIETLSPPSTASGWEKKICMEEIRKWLMENRAWVFRPQATSDCMVHEQHCFCYGGFRTEPESELDPEAAASDSAAKKKRPWCISTAGVTCVAWSSVGSRDGDAHTSEIFHHVWQAERVALAELRLEDVAFVECVPRYPAAERLGRQMSEACLAFWVVVGSQYLAVPSLRERFLGALLNRLTVEWHGPPSQEAVEIEFMHLFARSMQMTATDLICETDESRWAMYLHIANERGKKTGRVFTNEELIALPPWQLLTLIQPVGAPQRLDEWYVFMEANHPVQEGEAFFCDIDHHPGTRSTGGREWPSQLTHGTVLAVFERERWKMATPKEYMGALGFHSLPDYCSRFSMSPAVKVIDRLGLTDKEVRLLCGNGMHLMTQAAWMTYVLSNISEKEPLCDECVDDQDDEWS